MTRYLLDVATYQGSLSPAAVHAAGYSVVNLKISHGLTRSAVHPDIAGWVDSARALGLGISTFHYFTAQADGAEQAEYAYRQIAALGLTYGTAHQLDVECDPAPSLASVRAYLERMTQLLGRPVALYTGDWWWAARGKWNVSDLTPYLWAAPNRGYLGGYPGDTSPHWQAGYGGWTFLSVMQFGVGTLPGGTIDVSKSAIRNDAVWRSLTTGRDGMSYAPASLQVARHFYIDTLKQAGFTIDPLAVGIKGDDSHANAGTSYHLGKDALKSTAYSIVESSRDRAGLTDAAMALDLGKFSITVDGRTHNLRTFSLWLVRQCEANTPDTRDIREVIYSPDGVTVKRWDRLGIRTTGDSSHTEHTHESWFRDSEARDKTAHLRRYFTEIGVLEDPDMALTSDEIKAIAAATASAVWATPITDYADPAEVKRKVLAGTWIGYLDANRNRVLAAIAALRVVADATLKNVTDDDGESAVILAEIDRQAAELEAQLGGVPGAVLTALGDQSASDAQVAAALAAVLGGRAGAVGAILAGGA